MADDKAQLKARKKAHRFGLRAEKRAARWLRLKGYRILAVRYRNARGEIDIVAVRGKTLIAVEVKARQSFAECAELITPQKRQKIARAVEWLVAGQGKIAGLGSAAEHNIRFDAVWVVPWKFPKHIPDAWRL